MLLYAMFACSSDGATPKDTSTTPEDTDAGDSAPDDSAPDDSAGGTDTTPDGITLELTSVQTVIRATWTTEAPTVGLVRFGEDTTYRLTTPLETTPSTEHEVLLLGVAADTEVHAQVVTMDGESEVASADQTITTGPLPPEIPELSFTGEVSSWVGDYLIIPYQGTSLGVIVVDSRGEIVWYDTVDPGFNFMRAVFSVDGEDMVYCLAGPQDFLEGGSVARVSLDGETRTSTIWPFLDHDFTELPDGTIAGITVTPGPDGLGKADDIVELAPDGTFTTIWSGWDDPWLMEFVNYEIANWTHANALDYDPVEDVYYISSKELGTITKVDRSTGASIWHLNGVANEFTFPEGAEIVQMQHQFQVIDGGIVIFDNGELERGYSQAVEYLLDQDALTAEPIWEQTHSPPIGVYAKGDVERYADGGTRIVWSSAGEIQDVTATHEITWQLNTELGYAITFVQRVESLYGSP